MSPPNETQGYTQNRPVKIGEDWYDLEAAAGSERPEIVRRLIAWYLQRPGAELPNRPAVRTWRATASEAAQQRARDGVSIFDDKGHTKKSMIRIGDDWVALDAAVKAAGTDRSEVIRRLIAWYLRRPGSSLPERPPLGAWAAQAPRPIDDREAFEDAVKAIGRTPEEVIDQFMAWYLRRPEAELPKPADLKRGPRKGSHLRRAT
ncbi:hypothetical protein ACIA7S_28775 [Streptomyces sp. NPDC051643]|uniref:hypothetical protein n=1 Tax=Streptomyces sp. NPDC051643 TaxID=3365665 RepID=UPI0037979294